MFIDLYGDDCNHLNKSQALSGNSTVLQHMQDTPFLNKNIQFYQRRRHKLLRALAEAEPQGQPTCDPRQQLISLFQVAANKDNQISQLDYFIKHEFNGSIHYYSESLIQILWNLFQHRDGGVIAFLMYRLCRKDPSLFWQCFIRLSQNLVKNLQTQENRLQIIIFYTDLYLYGFPFTVQDFQSKIFPHFKHYPISLIEKYQEILTCSIFFSSRLQKIIMHSFSEWLELEKNKIISTFERLSSVGHHLQQLIIDQQENQTQSASYELELQLFQTDLYHFLNAAQKLEWQFDSSEYKLKTIFELKKQCKTFKTDFQLSAYQLSLYTTQRRSFAELKPLKKHQMLKMQESDAFINQIKLCTDINQCLNLSGYFLQQMNLQSNRDYLIETIINDCYSYNNLSYVLKIVFQIAQFQPSFVDYCNAKAKKICSSAKMNIKYQRLLCQMTKYRLVDENILLEYCEKIIKNQNHQTTKQIEFILENMGCITYYRSLAIHIRINDLFDKLQQIIKTKLTHFSVQHLYQLKGLVNYLRNHKNLNNKTQTPQIAKIQIKFEQNYNFLFKKMEKMAKQGQVSKIIDYLTCGIEEEEYLTSYYYSSLLKDLNCSDIESKMHQETLKIIVTNLLGLNSQKAVRWSRFLGQLYNYECINRKTLLQDFRQILSKANSPNFISGGIKCVCSSLQTSKSYLKMTNFKRERQIVLMLLELKCFYVRYKQQLEYALICQVQQIIEFFNPQIMAVLDQEVEIQQFIALCKKFIHNTSHTISHFISQLVGGLKIDSLRITDEVGSQTKMKYKQKEPLQKQERKWIEKSIKLVEKAQNNEVDSKVIPVDLQQKSKQSSAAQTAQGNGTTKKIKVIGRSKKDNKIKTVTCIYAQLGPQN